MSSMNVKQALQALVIGLLFCICGVSSAADELYKTVDGVAVYLGVVPAEIVQGHPKEHTEAQMHGGPPDMRGRYHVMVALFEQATGERITDAQLTATVGALGLAGAEKKLERMIVAGATTYGNYFAMPNPGPYRIDISIRQPGKARDIQVVFDYNHPVARAGR